MCLEEEEGGLGREKGEREGKRRRKREEEEVVYQTVTTDVSH